MAAVQVEHEHAWHLVQVDFAEHVREYACECGAVWFD